MLNTLAEYPNVALAGATPYTRLFGIASGGVYLAKGALAERREANGTEKGFTTLARYFAENQCVLAQGPGPCGHGRGGVRVE